jgi:hypothetical protein
MRLTPHIGRLAKSYAKLGHARSRIYSVGLLKQSSLAQRLHTDRLGQMTLEWALVLATVAIPMLVVFRICLAILVDKYRMMAMLNSLPCP